MYNVSLHQSMTDGRNTVQTTMTLRVVDVVDETPIITLSGTSSIQEELPIGSVISGLYSVRDADKGDNLTYSINGKI